jgi:hypothetical protein
MKIYTRIIAVIVIGTACLLMQPAAQVAQVKVATAQEPDHYKWLAARITEAHSIRPGMSRADLLKVFEPDGGFQPIPPETYVLRSCSLIKVKVNFEFPKGMSDKDLSQGTTGTAMASGENLPIDSEIKISAISRPYLELMHMD